MSSLNTPEEEMAMLERVHFSKEAAKWTQDRNLRSWDSWSKWVISELPIQSRPSFSRLVGPLFPKFVSTDLILP